MVFVHSTIYTLEAARVISKKPNGQLAILQPFILTFIVKSL